MVRAGCVFVAGIHPSRTWTSGSSESVRWNACVHRLDLGLYSHPKVFLGNGVWTHVNSKENIPSTGKFPKRIEPPPPPPPWVMKLNLSRTCYFLCCPIVVAITNENGNKQTKTQQDTPPPPPPPTKKNNNRTTTPPPLLKNPPLKTDLWQEMEQELLHMIQQYMKTYTWTRMHVCMFLVCSCLWIIQRCCRARCKQTYNISLCIEQVIHCIFNKQITKRLFVCLLVV